MKTRVVREYDTRHAVYVFHVRKWSLWDEPDLRQYYPDSYDWRLVTTVGDEETARRIAAGVAEGGEPTEVIAEFGS